MGSRDTIDEFKPTHKRFSVRRLRGSRKEDKLQDSLPSLLISTKMNSKRTTTSRNSTTESSQTRSMVESRATVYPASILDDQEYYQVPVMIPETVFEGPEQMATDDHHACTERRGGGMKWDIWAGPCRNAPDIPEPPPAVYPGDENLHDTPNLRFLTVHNIV